MNRTRRILLIFEWPLCHWGRAIIAIVIIAIVVIIAINIVIIAIVIVIIVNCGFKQFVPAVGIYAATNPLW